MPTPTPGIEGNHWQLPGAAAPPSPSPSLASLDLRVPSGFRGQSPAPIDYEPSDNQNTARAFVGPAGLDVPGFRPRRYLGDQECRLRQTVSVLEMANGQNHPETLNARLQLGMTFHLQGRLRLAEEILRQVVIDSRQFRDSHSGLFLEALESFGNLLENLGHLELARRCLKTRYRHGMSKLTPTHPFILRCRSSLMRVQRQLGDLQAAITTGKQVMESASSYNTPILRLEFATSCSLLAHAYLFRGNFRAAENLTLRAHKIFTELDWRNDLTFLSLGMGISKVYFWLGDTQKALGLVEPSYANLTRLCGEEHPLTLTVQVHLVFLRLQEKRWSEADDLSRSLISISSRVKGPNHKDTLYAYSARVEVLIAQGCWSESSVVMDALLSEWGTSSLAFNLDVSRILSLRCRALLGEGRLEEAETWSAGLVERFVKDHGTLPAAMGALEAMARTRFARGQKVEAKSFLEECIARSRKAFAPRHYWVRELEDLLEGWKVHLGDI
jgi:tetratricopeptide (TPR) repeat protein